MRKQNDNTQMILDSVQEDVLTTSMNILKAWDKEHNLVLATDASYENKAKNIVTDIIYTYFRNKLLVDYLIAGTVDTVQPRIKRLLSVALTQILFHNAVPLPVLVNTAVDYAKKVYGGKIAGFINAVLRKFASADIATVARDIPGFVQKNIPLTLFEKWNKRYGKTKTNEFSGLIKNKHDITFRLLPSFCSAEKEKFYKIKKKAGIYPFEYGKILPDGRFVFMRCKDAKCLLHSEIFRKGYIYIQDTASVAAVSMLSAADTHRNNKLKIADLCSAPGGKLLALKEIFPDSLIVSLDISLNRQKQTLSNLRRTRYDGEKFVMAGSAEYPPFEDEIFDKILIDVPCTGTGTFAHKPDVLFSYSEQKLKELCEKQYAILTSAAKLLKQGGELLYSTCSIEDEENSQQIRRFLKQHTNFSLLQERLILPSVTSDGAFAALLQKTGVS